MVGPVALVALALAQQPAPVASASGCALVAPNGDRIAFQVSSLSSNGDATGLISQTDSVWPSRTLVGNRMSPGRNSFGFGGERGLVIQMGGAEGQIRTVAIHRRQGNRIGLPLAFGYCRPQSRVPAYRALDPTIAENEIGADIAAFDLSRWPEDDCGLILSDGRRMRFRFRLDPGGSVQLSSPDLWSGRPVAVPMRWGRPLNGLQVGTFGRRGGPSGTQIMHMDERRGNGVKLIALSNLGDGSAVNLTGYAICGYRGLVRRPSRGG
jgi:hypothetical protein